MKEIQQENLLEAAPIWWEWFFGFLPETFQISHHGKGFDDWEARSAHPPSAALIRPFTPSPISSAASHHDDYDDDYDDDNDDDDDDDDDDGDDDDDDDMDEDRWQGWTKKENDNVWTKRFWCRWLIIFWKDNDNNDVDDDRTDDDDDSGQCVCV